MSYLSKYTNGRELREVVKRCAEHLVYFKFDALAVTGVSGMLVGAPLAYTTGKNLYVVRKNGESSHSAVEVEGHFRSGEKIIIVDDFIATGETIQNVYTSLNQCVEMPDVIGVYLYGLACLSNSITLKHNVELPILNHYNGLEESELASLGRTSQTLKIV